MESPGPGIYEDIPDAEYRAWDYPSYSTLALFRDPDNSELDVKYAIEHPREPTDEMGLGLLVEQALDDPKSLGAGVKQLPPEIKVRRGAAWQEFQRANPDIEWLPPSEYVKHMERIVMAAEMAVSVHNHPKFGVLIGDSKRQVSFVADLTFPGADGQEVTHRVKGRADYLNREKGIITDLKTTGFGSPRRVGANFWTFAYDVQTALYTDALSALLGQEIAFYFVVARTCKPYIVTVYNGHNTTEMAGGLLGIGRRAYQTYLEQLAECRRTGVWRGYYQEAAMDGAGNYSLILDVELPGWAV